MSSPGDICELHSATDVPATQIVVWSTVIKGVLIRCRVAEVDSCNGDVVFDRYSSNLGDLAAEHLKEATEGRVEFRASPTVEVPRHIFLPFGTPFKTTYTGGSVDVPCDNLSEGMAVSFVSDVALLVPEWFQRKYDSGTRVIEWVSCSGAALVGDPRSCRVL